MRRGKGQARDIRRRPARYSGRLHPDGEIVVGELRSHQASTTWLRPRSRGFSPRACLPQPSGVGRPASSEPTNVRPVTATIVSHEQARPSGTESSIVTVRDGPCIAGIGGRPAASAEAREQARRTTYRNVGLRLAARLHRAARDVRPSSSQGRRKPCRRTIRRERCRFPHCGRPIERRLKDRTRWKRVAEPQPVAARKESGRRHVSGRTAMQRQGVAVRVQGTRRCGRHRAPSTRRSRPARDRRND